jgi:Ca-activated chloride channel family protein
MPRESISISGLNSFAMHGWQRSPAALRLLVLLFLAPTALTQAQQGASRQSKPIRVSVDRVNVGVIVTDARGKFVAGLRREDFHIFDDGAEQPLTDFAAIEEPAQILLLVESGPAVYFLESSHLQAAHALLDGLSPGDRVAVVKYDRAPQLLLDFSADKQAATAALVNVRFNLGFGTLNLSRSLSTVLDWLAKTQGKKTIVLLSTGFDTSPPTQPEAVLARLGTGDVRILAISLSGALRNPPGAASKASPEKAVVAAQGFAEADRLLTALTATTGGRVYFPNSAKDFAAVYAEIAQLVRHEYSLAFAPPVHDGRIHAIEVRVSPPTGMPPSPSAPAYRIDHRRAYRAP